VEKDSHPALVRPHIDVVSGVHLAAITDISKKEIFYETGVFARPRGRTYRNPSISAGHLPSQATVRDRCNGQ
jgi:hypothetical protein